jgi:uncharacterized protein (TIGR03437 family)
MHCDIGKFWQDGHSQGAPRRPICFWDYAINRFVASRGRWYRIPMNTMQIIRLCLLAAVAIAPAIGQEQFNALPSRILGQAVFQQSSQTAVAPNLVEGREIAAAQSAAVDMSSGSPILYVADSFNNRVLAWKNANSVANGSFADLVIGQKDRYSSAAQPAGGANSIGLVAPTAVAVDAKGNLYVLDAGNNRILRFPAPFSQPGPTITPDLVLGQVNFSSGSANQGLNAPTAATLAVNSGSGPYQTGMALDGAGNLWVTDSGNNRVLRYPASSLGSGAANDPAADLVLGQTGFTTNSLPSGANATMKNFLAAPNALAFDAEGDLYVTDGANRMLVFPPPFYTGQSAARIAGVVIPTQTNPNPPQLSAQTLGRPNYPPQGIFFINDAPFVVDEGNNRIVGYPPYSKWPAETQQFGPTASFVLGQPDFTSSKPNGGNPEPSAQTLNFPVGAAATANDVFVCDAGNNRVLDFPISGGAIASASRVFGQLDFPYNAVNLIEGREFYFYTGAQNVNGANYYLPGGMVAIDTTSTPAHLYVADPGNNRILGFNDYRQAQPGQKADIVIGQPDFYHALINYPTNDPNQPSATSLYSPHGVAVDSNGDLWVADSGNGRVLRFPKPFSQPAGALQQANLVLGQYSFNQSVKAPTAQTMYSPYGLAFTVEGDLAVSDQADNRVLLFLKPSGGFTNGQTAASVIGQPDFNSTTANNAASGTGGLNGPHGIGIDTGDQLYVADTGNNRIAVYRNIRTTGNNPTVSLVISANQPNGVTINPSTGEIWVLSTGSNQVIRLPNFSQILLGFNTPIQTLTVPVPLGIALDPSGNPLFADGANSVAFYYPLLANVNAANYFHRYTPGMIATLFATTGTTFSNTTASATLVNNALPTSLGGVEVLVNGKASPLFYVSPTQINYQIPYETPQGQQDFEVVQVSTNQVLADGTFFVEQSSPGLFTTSQSGQGQIAAINADNNQPNSAANPVKAGHYISIFGTGLGSIPGAPPDGVPASGAVPAAITTQVYAGGTSTIPQSDVEYSGLAPGFVGLWQINFKVPANAAPGTLPVIVIYNGNNTRIDSQGDPSVSTFIYVSQ